MMYGLNPKEAFVADILTWRNNEAKTFVKRKFFDYEEGYIDADASLLIVAPDLSEHLSSLVAQAGYHTEMYAQARPREYTT